MHERNDDYICLVLLETLIGKRRFINSITKSSEINGKNNCYKTSPKIKVCTKKNSIIKDKLWFCFVFILPFFIFI